MTSGAGLTWPRRRAPTALPPSFASVRDMSGALPKRLETIDREVALALTHLQAQLYGLRGQASTAPAQTSAPRPVTFAGRCPDELTRKFIGASGHC